MPFLHFDQELKQGDVTILDGMAGADGMCRPLDFHVFVFVAGRFAGTLSPAPMSSRLDGAASVVRLRQADTITAEFQRYTSTDALCCPSSRVTVTYTVDRSGKAPVVKATGGEDDATILGNGEQGTETGTGNRERRIREQRRQESVCDSVGAVKKLPPAARSTCQPSGLQRHPPCMLWRNGVHRISSA